MNTSFKRKVYVGYGKTVPTVVVDSKYDFDHYFYSRNNLYVSRLRMYYTRLCFFPFFVDSLHFTRLIFFVISITGKIDVGQ